MGKQPLTAADVERFNGRIQEDVNEFVKDWVAWVNEIPGLTEDEKRQSVKGVIIGAIGAMFNAAGANGFTDNEEVIDAMEYAISASRRGLSPAQMIHAINNPD
jgi:hypothetical protein